MMVRLRYVSTTMSKFEPGCLAVIIQSAIGHTVGKIVQCVKIKGEHSLYGTVWEVRSREELVTEYGGHGHLVDVPAKWMRPIEPGDHLKTVNKVEELQQ